MTSDGSCSAPDRAINGKQPLVRESGVHPQALRNGKGFRVANREPLQARAAALGRCAR